MAKRPSKKTKAKEEFIGRAELKRLWTVRPARQWLSLLQELNPDGKWSIQGEHSIKGCCPYHDDNTPSFVISFNRGFAKCFGSCGTLKSDLVSIIARAANMPYVEALLFIQNYFGLSEELGKQAEYLAVYHRQQEMKKAAALAMKAIIPRLVNENPPELAYLKPALAHLTVARKLDLSNLHNLPVGLYAKPEHLKALMEEKYHADFDDYFNEAVRGPNFWGAVVFHYNDTPGSIARFKLRLLDRVAVRNVTEVDPKFENITEEQANSLLSREMLFVADEHSPDNGIFGLHKYQHLLGHHTDPNVYITEGEFDVLSVMNAQESLGSYDFVLLGTSGSGSLNVGFLKDYGVRTVWLVQDAPAKHGDNWARNFLAEKGNFVKPGSPIPFAVKVFQWPVTLRGGDLDEALRMNGYDALREVLFTERNSMFLNSNLWLVNKCDQQIKNIKIERDQAISQVDTSKDEDGATVEIQNIKHDAHRRIHATILEWFRYIHDPTERLAFAQRYATQEDIDITQDSKVHSEVYALDTREGVYSKLIDAFREHLEFAYYERSGKTYTVYAWSKAKNEIVAIATGDSNTMGTISQYLPEEYVGWVESLLRDTPAWIPEGKDFITDEKNRHSAATMYMRTVINSERSRCANAYSLTKIGQGIHHFGLPGSIRAEGKIYVVNGNKVFRGAISRESGIMEWEQLNNCVDDSLLFKLDHKDKWSFVDDVSDLYDATNVNLKGTFWKIHKILDGWSFDHHDVTTRYLAAQVMSLPIAAAIGNVNIMYVTGESESGKTSLLRLLGGTKNHGYDISPVLETAEFCMDTTPAAMYQKYDRSSKAMVYDEAEVSESHNTSHDTRTKEIQRVIMGVPMGGVPFSRGGQTADQQTDYFVRMPIIMAGINLPADRVLMSRILVVYTRKEHGHRSLSDYISEHFKSNEIEELRRDITVGLLPHIPDLIRRRRELKQELACIDPEIKVSDRFLDNIVTPLLVYEFAGGGDAGELFKELYYRNKDRLDCIHGADSTSDLLNACLYTASIKITMQDGMTDFVSARSLIVNGDAVILNNSNCGIYYYPEREWIIFVWRQVKYTVLKGTVYGRQQEDALRERVSKTSSVVNDITLEDHQQIKALFGIREVQSPTEYTVIRADYLGMDSEIQEQIEQEYAVTGGASADLPPVHVYEEMQQHLGSVAVEDPAPTSPPEADVEFDAGDDTDTGENFEV